MKHRVKYLGQTPLSSTVIVIETNRQTHTEDLSLYLDH